MTAYEIVSILKAMSGKDGWRAAWKDIFGFDHVEHWNDVLEDGAHPIRDLVCLCCGERGSATTRQIDLRKRM